MILIAGLAPTSQDTDHTYRAPTHSLPMLFALNKEHFEYKFNYNQKYKYKYKYN